jgi:phosphatidate cytidylyltransferase
MNLDPVILKLFGGVLGLLTVSSTIGAILRTKVRGDGGRKVVENLIARTNAWWIMAVIFAAAITLGSNATLLMFAGASFFALREFITLTPTRRGDHRSLFWAFFVILPLHYITLSTAWYGLYVLLIPVYAYLFIPMRAALAGDTQNFLERTAKVQWGLMVAVYFLSYAPALMTLEIPEWSAHHPERNARLLFFLVFVVQISDVMQYVWGKLCGKRPIVPKLSPNKTVEGFFGGGLTAVVLGGALWWATPFSPLAAAGLSAVIVVMGFFGGLVMSAIKRDRGVKDYGDLIPGHGGVMDRVDSLCFAAPVFFHLVRWIYQ